MKNGIYNILSCQRIRLLSPNVNEVSRDMEIQIIDIKYFVITFNDAKYAFLTDLTQSAGKSTCTLTREAVDKVCARATILAGVGRTFVHICPQKDIYTCALIHEQFKNVFLYCSQ